MHTYNDHPPLLGRGESSEINRHFTHQQINKKKKADKYIQ